MKNKKGTFLGLLAVAALMLGIGANKEALARSLGRLYGNSLHIENEPRSATPDVTVGADDAYIKGTLEVDAATRLDGALDLNSTLTVSGAADVDSTFDIGGMASLGKSQQGTSYGATTGIYASTTVVPTSSYIVLVSSGGNIQFTSTPNISTATAIGGSTAWPDGSLLVFTTTATAVITFVDEDTLSGSRLQLGSTTRAIGQYDTLTLIYSAQDNYWREMFFVNN